MCMCKTKIYQFKCTLKSKFIEYGALEYAEEVKNSYRANATAALNDMLERFPKINMFNDLSEYLLGREA